MTQDVPAPEFFRHAFVVDVPLPLICLEPDGDRVFYSWLKAHMRYRFDFVMAAHQYGNNDYFTRGLEQKRLWISFDNRDDAITFKMSYKVDMLMSKPD